MDKNIVIAKTPRRQDGRNPLRPRNSNKIFAAKERKECGDKSLCCFFWFFSVFGGILNIWAANLVQRPVLQSQRDCIPQPSVGPIQRGPTLGCQKKDHNPERVAYQRLMK